MQHRRGGPNEVTVSEMTEKIHDLVVNNRRLKIHEIAETLGISIERMQNRKMDGTIYILEFILSKKNQPNYLILD